jgi:hypothetical protein
MSAPMSLIKSFPYSTEYLWGGLSYVISYVYMPI